MSSRREPDQAGSPPSRLSQSASASGTPDQSAGPSRAASPQRKEHNGPPVPALQAHAKSADALSAEQAVSHDHALPAEAPATQAARHEPVPSQSTGASFQESVAAGLARYAPTDAAAPASQLYFRPGEGETVQGLALQGTSPPETSTRPHMELSNDSHTAKTAEPQQAQAEQAANVQHSARDTYYDTVPEQTHQIDFASRAYSSGEAVLAAPLDALKAARSGAGALTQTDNVSHHVPHEPEQAASHFSSSSAQSARQIQESKARQLGAIRDSVHSAAKDQHVAVTLK